MKKIILLIGLAVFTLPLFAQTTIENGMRGSVVRNILNSTFDTLYNYTKVFNVLDYGAVGDGVTDDTDEIKAAIAAIKALYTSTEKGAQLYFPGGEYIISDSLLIDEYVDIRGDGPGNSSIIRQTADYPIFHVKPVNPAYPYSNAMATIEDLVLLGTANAAHTNQSGIVLQNNAYTVRDCQIRNHGAYGVKFATHDAHAYTFRIKDCKVQNNHIAGIYGLENETYQLNDITISGTNVNGNYGPGLHIFGDQIDVFDNEFQSNDSAGVYVSAYEHAGVEDIGASTINIIGNWFEGNGGGGVFAEVSHDGSDARTIDGLVIRGNYFNENSVNVDKFNADACVTLELEPGSAAWAGIYFRDIRLGINDYNNYGTLAKVDGNSILTNRVQIFIYAAGTLSDYIGLGGAIIEWKGSVSSGGHEANPTAVGGITEAMLSSTVLVYLTAPVNITANPQIVDGIDGFTMTLFGNSDVNTLTLDDGTGLRLAGGASFVMGQGDIIVLKYIAFFDNWVEISRSDN